MADRDSWKDIPNRLTGFILEGVFRGVMMLSIGLAVFFLLVGGWRIMRLMGMPHLQELSQHINPTRPSSKIQKIERSSASTGGDVQRREFGAIDDAPHQCIVTNDVDESAEE